MSRIEKYEPIEVSTKELNNSSEKTMLVMLSDIHYGMYFRSVYGNYDTDIAKERVMKYAQSIIYTANLNNAKYCKLVLMGDLISGAIHRAIRLENRQNLVEQVTGVSELISEFIHYLAEYFNHIEVHNVNGNHSRFEENPSDCLTSERMDAFIPWYCKAKLGNIDNVSFVDNTIDTTLSVINIYDKTYVAVHGDFDADISASATKLTSIVNKRIDYMLAGHLHVASSRFENTGLIRNGAVLTGGDNFTTKNRLFGPAVQVCMVCTANGIESIYPVQLS